MNPLNHKWSRWPLYDPEEVGAVARVLESGCVNYWTGGEGHSFEQEFSSYCGVKHAIALANGTVALELALRALGVGAGDEVIVTARTFVASASAIVMVGATPVFADVDRESQNITRDTIREKITPKTRAVIAVHLAGHPCDMDPIMALAEEHEIKVIEDCAQAHGATYKGRKVGSLGHVAAFSFCQDKIISTGGEGGMLLTDDDQVWQSGWEFKDHGKSREAVFERKHPTGFRWLHDSIGTNWRMTEMQAAIGRLQLGKLDQWVAQRNSYAMLLNSKLSGCAALRCPTPSIDFLHAFYKYYIFFDESQLMPGWNQGRIIDAINQQGVFCQSGTCPLVNREQAFSLLSADQETNLPVAEELGRTSLMLLVDPSMTHAQMEMSAEVILDISAHAFQ